MTGRTLPALMAAALLLAPLLLPQQRVTAAVLVPTLASRSEVELPSPPGRKGADPKNWARLDLPYTFQPAVIWVKIQPGKRIDELMQRYGLPGPARQLWEPPHNAIAKQIGLERWYEVGVPRGGEKEIVRRLSPEHAPDKLADFVYVHISWDFPGRALLTPIDPEFPNQSFYLDAMGMRRAWDKQVASDAIIIAVIDSGLRGSHEDSAPYKQKVGWDYVNSENIFPGADTEWYFGRACFNGDGHGTQVATIAAADTNNFNNNKGIAGTGFNAAIMPFRTMGQDPNGPDCKWVVPQDRRGWSIRTATDRGAKVINMSYTFGTESLPFEDESIQYAWNSGAIPVSGAGNDGVDVKYFPCGYNFVICIGSAYWNGSAWARWTGTPNPSNGGAAWVDFSAPGRSIEGATANTTTSYKFGTGTSYATPLVSGVFALLHADGALTPTDKLNRLAAASCPDGWTGNGFVKAGDALWGTRSCP